MIKDNLIENYEDHYKYDCLADVTYYINQVRGVIVCKIKPFTNIPFKFYDGTNKEHAYRSFFDMCTETNVSFVGKATCMAGDTFDLKIGKRIAYDKALIKMLKARDKFLTEQINDMLTCVQDYTEILDDVSNRLNKAEEHLFRKIEETK